MKKTIKDFSLDFKTVILRCDLNVTIKDNYIIIKNPREMCLCNGDGALQVRIEKDDYI